MVSDAHAMHVLLKRQYIRAWRLAYEAMAAEASAAGAQVACAAQRRACHRGELEMSLTLKATV